MAAACNFISLGEKMRELLDKNGARKEKEKRKITDHMIGQKKGAKFARCVAVYLAKLNDHTCHDKIIFIMTKIFPS